MEIEAEEAAGLRRLVLNGEYEFSNLNLEAFYTEFDRPGVLVAQPWARRARELES